MLVFIEIYMCVSPDLIIKKEDLILLEKLYELQI
jgi:hypothetical protein